MMFYSMSTYRQRGQVGISDQVVRVYSSSDVAGPPEVVATARIPVSSAGPSLNVDFKVYDKGNRCYYVPMSQWDPVAYEWIARAVCIAEPNV